MTTTAGGQDEHAQPNTNPVTVNVTNHDAVPDADTVPQPNPDADAVTDAQPNPDADDVNGDPDPDARPDRA